MDLHLSGKRVLVTGASRGIGLAIVRAFEAEGAEVVAVSRRSTPELEATGAVFVAADLSAPDGPRRMVETVLAAGPRLDVLVNNAGSPSQLGSIEEVDAQAFRATQEVNVMGALYGIKHAAGHLRRQGTGGSIINIASITGDRVVYAGVAYSVSKAALVNLTKWAAAELGRHDIRVNSIAPGFITTARFGKAAGVTEEQAQDRLNALADYARERAKSMQAIPRPGFGSDVTGAAVYLAGDASSYMTGQNLVIDGGLSRGQPLEAMVAIRDDMARIYLG